MARSTSIENMPPTMTGRAATPAPDTVSAEDDFHFHALLYPNRSLSKDGFIRVLGVVIGVNLINAVIYVTLGAWPVAFFCGVDVVLVWWAFHLSYQHGRRHERLMLTDDALWVSRVLPSGHETRWKLCPYWMRVDVARPINHESQIRLIEKGRTLIVGSFLSPEERGELAEALGAALARARAA